MDRVASKHSSNVYPTSICVYLVANVLTSTKAVALITTTNGHFSVANSFTVCSTNPDLNYGLNDSSITVIMADYYGVCPVGSKATISSIEKTTNYVFDLFASFGYANVAYVPAVIGDLGVATLPNFILDSISDSSANFVYANSMGVTTNSTVSSSFHSAFSAGY